MTQLTILTPAEKRQFDSPPQFTQVDRQRYFFMSGQLRSIVSRIRRPDNKIGFVLQWGYFCARARFYPADQFKGSQNISGRNYPLIGSKWLKTLRLMPSF
jgi:hypothetical protein